MERYHTAWRTTSALVAVVGLFVAVQRLGITASATLYVLSAMLVAAVAAAVQPEDADEVWRAAVRPGLVGGAVGLAIFGMVFVLGPAALLLPLAGAMSSPPALRWFRHHLGAGGQNLRTSGAGGATLAADFIFGPEHVGRTAPARTDGHTSTPEAMSDADLCWEWRRSYGLLQRSGSVTARLRVVKQRQRYLDELERRNPTGLSGWLSSQPRAADDPSRYIQPADPGDPP